MTAACKCSRSLCVFFRSSKQRLHRGLVPGGHLYKGHTLSSNGRQGCTGGSDEDLEAGWLKGKKHPVTGEPLRIFRPALPPGSMASILTYSPHGVAPRPEGSGTRWASLFAYAVR